ncbi:hypothetical protein A4V11_08320 [Pediococcus acidilactici]|uniref:YeiH family protein n=1 Tax=Pediococcus acidilactici TaxID=1254 RepID=UPI000878CEAE|nr:putative sulfate exporter family transporter [Pediococcus acidilactici]AOW75021.1 hypothetical protein A4V11_08320 [Pediococcus acidilactici]
MAKLVKEKSFWTAIGVTLLCALAGSLLAQLPYFSLIGALVISLVLGMLVQFSPRVVEKSKKGTGFISNKFLRLGIILLGFKLNLIDLAHAGVKTILLAVLIVGLTILVVYNLARKFNVESNLAMLVASGTGICGAAAVMGISPQIQVPADQEEQKREDEVMAIAVVAILGTVFTFIEIGFKSWLHLTPTQFGVVAGGSLHEIAHAVATGGAGGPVSLDTAIITKLSRVLLLAPVALIIGFWHRRRNEVNVANQVKGKLPIPWFMGGFILASVVGTFLPLGAGVLAGLVKLAYIFLGMAMAALGMSVNFRVILKRGKGPFAAATIGSVLLLIFVIMASKWFF